MTFLDTVWRYLGNEPPAGSSRETAIVVDSVAAEYTWIRQNFWDLKPGNQNTTQVDGRCFDIIELQDASGSVVRTIYFDITSFMGDDEPAAPSAPTPVAHGSPPQTSGTAVPASNSDALFPIDNAEQYIGSNRHNVERNGRVIRWQDLDGIVELTVEPIVQRTYDDLVVRERVTLSYCAPWLNELTARQALVLNKWATLGAFVPADAGSPGRLICKVGVFDGDRAAAERVYAPLICTEAMVIAWHAARMARSEFSVDPDLSPLTRTDEAPPFDTADFDAVNSLADQHGLVATLGEHQFTVEFPWDPGARSRLFAKEELREKLLAGGDRTPEEVDRLGGRTSLLQILTTEPHPLYGNGVLCRLEIPVATDDDKAASLIDELNRWELSGDDLPPLFGAWCMGPRAPTFVTFIPNQYCVPGLLQNLYVWAQGRHGRVRDWLEASTTHN